MRPRGEVRIALIETFRRMEVGDAKDFRQVHEATLPALQASGCDVSPHQVRATLDNMVRAGDVIIAGRDKDAGSKRWRALFSLPITPQDEPPADHSGLVFVMRDWASR